jgi:flagellin
MAQVDITRIASNIGAMNALLALENVGKQLSIHQTRLATGKRINSAADDPAGLTIATKLQTRSEGLKVALSNIGDAKNLLAVAESGLGRLNDIILQMRSKSEQAASDTLGMAEREAVMVQLRSYAAQVDDIVKQTQWNGNSLIDGTFLVTALTFQTGAGKDDTTTLNGLANMSATDSNTLNGSSLTLASVDKLNVSVNLNASYGSSTVTTAGSAAGAGNLTTGTFKIEVTYNAAGSATVVLKDLSGSIKSSTTLNTTAGSATFTSGSGITATIAGATGFTIGTTYTSYLSFVREGDYNLRTNGNTGNVLSAASSAADFNAYMAYLDTKLDSVSAQLAKIGAMTGRLSFKEEQVANAQINVEASYSRIMDANMAEEQVNASKLLILQQTSTAMLAQANQAPQYLLSLFR